MPDDFFDFDRERLKYCYQCGKCSSGCDVNNVDSSFQPHKILHLLTIGMTDRVIEGKDIWKCTTCFTCSERCPQGIKVTDIIWIAKTMAVKSGHIPDLVVNQKDALLRTGRIHSVSSMDNKKREKAGLVQLTEEPSVVEKIFKISVEDE